MNLLKFLSLFFTLCLSAEESNWQALENYTQKNNQRLFLGEIVHNHNGMNLEEATLEIQTPHFVELKLKNGFLLFRLEPGKISTSNPTERPLLAKAWEFYVAAQRGLASVSGSESSFFDAYKNSELFKVTSLYTDPFHQIEITSEEHKQIPFKKISLFFDSKNRFQQARIFFKNGLYANFTTQSSLNTRKAEQTRSVTSLTK